MADSTPTPKTKSTKTTGELAGRWIASQLRSNPALTRKALGEIAARQNPIGDSVLSAKAIVEKKVVGRKMPGNGRGHYFAEGFTFLYENRDNAEFAGLPLVEVVHGSRTTFVPAGPAEEEAPAS